MGRWPETSAASLLKEAADDFYPESHEYVSYTGDSASALCAWIGTDPRIRADKPNAHKRCWQLRCTSSSDDPNQRDDDGDNGGYGRERLRVLMVHGATSMFALTKYVVEAFGWRELNKNYDPQPSKGTVPPGSHWTAERAVDGFDEDGTPALAAGIIGTPNAAYKAAGNGAPFFHEKKVKVYQVFRKRGDVLVYRCDDDREVTVRLDGVESKTQRYSHNAEYTPKCVGADGRTLPKQAWTELNGRYLQKKKQEEFIVAGVMTKEQLEDAAANTCKVPLFDNRGNSFPHPSNAGFDDVAEMHRVVALPYVD